MTVTREQFRNELHELKLEIEKMSILSGEALQKAIDVFFNQDLESAKTVIAEDGVINKMDVEINETSVLLIAKQAPVASDLRKIIISLRIVTDVERMADNATNIAKAALEIGKHDLDIPEGIKQMHDITQEMLKSAMQAFKTDDIEMAAQLSETDRQVDDLYKQVISELLGRTATEPDKIQFIMQVAFTARYIERFADHIKNIGENIIYLVKGDSIY